MNDESEHQEWILCPKCGNKTRLKLRKVEQAMFKQSLGLNEWDPIPEGVTYTEGIR